MSNSARSLSIYRPEYLSSVRDRLLSYRVVDENDCWIFTGAKTSQSYGKLAVGMGQIRTNVLAYMLYRGDIVANVDVCHSCNVKACFNPDHLYLASRSENVQHACRDRLTRHHGQHGARITDDQVREIRSKWKAGESSQCALAYEFSVDQQIVSRIVNGKAFRWVDASA